MQPLCYDCVYRNVRAMHALETTAHKGVRTMATMTRFVPFRSGFEEVSELQQRLQRVFEGAAAREQAGSFVPAVDVYEDESKLVLKLEVPGIRQEDLDVRVENMTLTVQGQRRFEAAEKEENFHRIERRFGSFTRSFTLPRTVDAAEVTASSLDGVLTITLAKRAEAKPRQIRVEVGSPAQKAVEGSAEHGK